MDGTIALPDDIVTLLADCDSSFAVTRSQYAMRRGLPNATVADEIPIDRVFEESLLLKRLLDDAHRQDRPKQTSTQLLAVDFNCEYLIAWLNSATPLRHNPFLSHWVEAIQQWNDDSSQKGHRNKYKDEGSSKPEVLELRVALIQRLLEGVDLSSFDADTPLRLARKLQVKDKDSFSISSYVRMLEEEDIYERSPSADVHESETSAPPSSSATAETASSPSSPASPGDESIRKRIAAEPEQAVSILAHLPFDVPSLEVINRLVKDSFLETMSLDSAHVVREVIQYRLRQIERMGRLPASAADMQTSSDERDDPATFDGLQYGREEQYRAVELLVLFMRSLISKALVAPEHLYFEVQELCTRYLMLQKVREFRAWAEGQFHAYSHMD